MRGNELGDSAREVTDDLAALASRAWAARDNAHTFGGTKVGCAVLSSTGEIFDGCNVEHRFRSHDVHAEVNALTSMVSHGVYAVSMIVIVAERDRFTPCGACMDWIFQFGGDNAVVAFQGTPGGRFDTFTAAELMPYYPH
jgi:cytidine deaminase